MARTDEPAPGSPPSPATKPPLGHARAIPRKLRRAATPATAQAPSTRRRIADCVPDVLDPGALAPIRLVPAPLRTAHAGKAGRLSGEPEPLPWLAPRHPTRPAARLSPEPP